MKFLRSFHIFNALLVAWSFGVLAWFVELHGMAIGLFTLAFGTCLLRERLGLVIKPWMWLIASVVALLLAVYGWFVLRQHLYSVVYLFLYLEINKLWTARRNTDYLQIYGLTFFQMLAASVSTASVGFAPALLVYLFLTLGAMISVTMKTDMEIALGDQNNKRRGRARRRPEVARDFVRLRTHDSRRLRYFYDKVLVTPQWLWRLGGVLTLIAILGSFLFFLIPRMQARYFLGGLTPTSGSQAVSGFSDEVNFSSVSEIQTDPTIAMRVQPGRQFPLESDGYPREGLLRLRGTSLDFFDGSRWRKTQSAEQPNDVSRQSRVAFMDYNERGARADYYEITVTMEPSSRGYLFGAGQPVFFALDAAQPVRIDTDARSVQLELQNWSVPLRYTAGSVALNSALREPQAAPSAPQTAGLISAILPQHRRDFGGNRNARDQWRSFLRQVRARTIPGLDVENTHRRYLQLPDNADIATVRELSAQWVGEAESPQEIARMIEGRLQRNYEYSLDIDFATKPDHLTEFLVRQRRGHCEYYATAMVLMLRAQGIPARIVNGYATDEWVPNPGYFLVRKEHAHSWVEAWVRGRGWVTYDPTPSSGIGGNRIPSTLYRRISRVLDSLKLVWYDKFIDYNAEDQAYLYRAMFRGYRALPSIDGLLGAALGRNRSGGGMAYIVLGVGGLGLGVLGWMTLRNRRKRIARRQREGVAIVPGQAPPEYLELLDAVEKVVERPPAQTPLEYAREVVVKRAELDDLLPLTENYYGARYDGLVWSPNDTQRANALLRQLRAGGRVASAGRQQATSATPTQSE